jgi:hypothetical protein
MSYDYTFPCWARDVQGYEVGKRVVINNREGYPVSGIVKKVKIGAKGLTALVTINVDIENVDDKSDEKS